MVPETKIPEQMCHESKLHHFKDTLGLFPEILVFLRNVFTSMPGKISGLLHFKIYSL